MQLVLITTKVVSLNPAHVVRCTRYNIHYVVKLHFVRDLRQQFGGFLRVLLISSTNKTDHHDITEIILKMALNTIALTLCYTCNTSCFF